MCPTRFAGSATEWMGFIVIPIFTRRISGKKPKGSNQRAFIAKSSSQFDIQNDRDPDPDGSILSVLRGLPASGFTTTLGILALVLGGLDLTAAILHLSLELPVFAILLIVLGAIMLTRELRN